MFDARITDYLQTHSYMTHVARTRVGCESPHFDAGFQNLTLLDLREMDSERRARHAAAARAAVSPRNRQEALEPAESGSA